MTSLADATKAPVPFTLDGKEVRISPLELHDFGELERWLKARPFEEAAEKIRALGDTITTSLRNRFINEAEEESKLLGRRGSEEAKEVLDTIAGTGFILWLSLRKSMLGVTQAEVSSMVTIESLPAIQKAIDDISGLSGAAGDGEDRPTVEETTP